MIRFEDLEEKVQQYHPSTDLTTLRRAYKFSAREHTGQVRRSGEPYLSHPLEVANLLADMKLDVATVSVGLLHDVVEDTLVSLDKLREEFGDDIARIVDGVTKISQIQFSSRWERQAENFRKLVLAMVDDIRVILVKLADRLHNMRTLEHLPAEKQKLIAQETMEIYAPISHRLGMAKIRGELEDLAFHYLDPVSYRNIVSQVEARRANSEKFIRQVIRRLRETLQEHQIEAQIESRIKRTYSIYMKLRRRKIRLDQVYDFIAIRVLVGSVRDCYTVLGIANHTWNSVPGRIKDFIAMPSPNMYQSLHTTVVGLGGQPFEVQIRTSEMHRLAEEGIAAHWKYKEGKLDEERDDKRFAWLRRVLEWQREVTDPQHFLSNLKIDLYPEEVYAFTPKGEVIALPRGASPLDFAYAIHTEVGNRCIGTKVNGRIVPLKYKLSNGDRVEILTAKEGRPSRDWLSLVKTSKARGNIRRWINLRQKEQAIELGQKLLGKEARRCGLSFKKIADQLETVATQFKHSKTEDLLASIGYGKVFSRQILQVLAPDKVAQEADPPSTFRSVVGKVFPRSSESAIQVKEHEDLLVRRAKCCNPIRGEEIVGYITVGRGISVHSATCPNVENLLLNPDRKIAVQWTANGDEQTKYSVRLFIYTEDRTGILADITAAISRADTNIVDAQARTVDNRYGAIDVTVEITDLDHLETILNFVKGIEGVQDVERIRSGTTEPS